MNGKVLVREEEPGRQKADLRLGPAGYSPLSLFSAGSFISSLELIIKCLEASQTQVNYAAC